MRNIWRALESCCVIQQGRLAVASPRNPHRGSHCAALVRGAGPRRHRERESIRQRRPSPRCRGKSHGILADGYRVCDLLNGGASPTGRGWHDLRELATVRGFERRHLGHRKADGRCSNRWFNPSTAHHSLCSSAMVYRSLNYSPCNKHATSLTHSRRVSDTGG